MSRLNPPPATRVRRAAAGVLCAVLATVLGGCTGGSSAPAPAGTPSPEASTGPETTLAAKPVPLDVRVTRVAGRLRKKDQASVERNVGRTIDRYFDAAFLGGDYPRSRFGDAFAGFSSGAARDARRERDLLTNRTLGPTTASVAPRKKQALLSVLAPHKVAAGVTALVRLEFVADRGDAPAQLVTLTGRLLLTRKKGGGWEIFGYDLARSTTPANGASR